MRFKTVGIRLIDLRDEIINIAIAVSSRKNPFSTNALIYLSER